MKKIILILVLFSSVYSFSQNYKIFAKGNIFYIQNTLDNKIYEGLKNEVLAKKEKYGDEEYSFKGVNGWDPSFVIPFSAIKDENGNSYESIGVFDLFLQQLGLIGKSNTASSSSIFTKTSDYTLTSSDSTILFDATLSPITVTMPTASLATGRIFYLRKNDSTDNALIFSPPLKLNNEDVAALNYSRTIKIQSDGNRYVIID